MRIRIEVTSGARRGLRRTFEGPRVSVGRHPDCDLQLDPEVDRAASARHAVFLLAGGRWIVRDVGSRNGTFVDDDPVEGERRLRDGDVVQFGRQGPRARVEVLTSETSEFEQVGEGGGAGEAEDRGGGDGRPEERRRAAAGAGSSPPKTASGAAEPAAGSGSAGRGGGSSGGGSDAGGSTTDRLRQQVERRGKGLVALAVVLAAILGAGVAWFLLGGSGASGAPDGPAVGPAAAGSAGGGAEASAASPERTDSMLQATRQTLDSLRGRVSGLQQALEDSRTRVAEIQRQLRQARDDASGSGGAGGAAERRALQRRLDSALTELRRQSELATTDFSAVQTGRWRALAQVYVEGDGGDVATATAFAVRAEGLLVTSRHVVLAEDGTPAARIGVQFARSDQVWPAELVATHDRADLALLRVRNVRGDVPVIPVLDAEVGTVAEGSPVAVLGYSGGRRAPTSGEAAGRLPRPSLSVGLLLERGEDRLRVRGFGAEGGSGSPIFDADGRLVGVLRGGIDDGAADGRRILIAVPARVVRSLLETVLERLGG